jgi:hypothetical protein
MGPVRGGYKLAALPNRWEDARVISGLIRDSWKKSLAAYAARRGARAVLPGWQKGLSLPPAVAPQIGALRHMSKK